MIPGATAPQLGRVAFVKKVKERRCLTGMPFMGSKWRGVLEAPFLWVRVFCKYADL